MPGVLRLYKIDVIDDERKNHAKDNPGNAKDRQCKSTTMNCQCKRSIIPSRVWCIEASVLYEEVCNMMIRKVTCSNTTEDKQRAYLFRSGGSYG